MHTFVLQDWLTLGGGAATIVQDERSYLDLEPFQDVVAWLEVSSAVGSPTIKLQTSPTKDEAFFMTMTASATAMAASAIPAVIQATLFNAAVPLARYLRWVVSGTPAWSVTFRVVVAANAPGL